MSWRLSPFDDCQRTPEIRALHWEGRYPTATGRLRQSTGLPPGAIGEAARGSLEAGLDFWCLTANAARLKQLG
jgi:hypothetical protein